MDVNEKVIIKAINGDSDAFREIVETYKDFVFVIILNITMDYHEAENLAQETFIQVFRSLSFYRFNGFRTWIGRIATNKAIDWKRKMKTARQGKMIYIEDVDSLDCRYELSTHIRSPEEEVIKREEAEKVNALWR